MPQVEPIPDEAAAIATVDGERALLIADYHAGVEAGLRVERGVQVPSRAAERRERLRSLVERTSPDRLVVAGDLMHSIGDPSGAERGELEVLFESLPSLPVTLVKGNHDGAIESWLGGSTADEDGESGVAGDLEASDVELELSVEPGSGVRLGDVGICHGHGWPSPAVLEADVVCMGHEHPCVRLEDEIGGSRVEPAWLRGRLDAAPFRPRPEYESVEWLSPPGDASTADPDGTASDSNPSTTDTPTSGPDAPTPDASSAAPSTADATTPGGQHHEAPSLVVLPAFNDLVGGTWVNVPGQSFLAPFLPAGLSSADAYLLDGTRLGPYESV